MRHGITYDQSLEEAEACVYAGLDFERWENEPGTRPYSNRLKVFVIAAYRAHMLINAHIGDARITEAKRVAKKNELKQKARRKKGRRRR